jgi:hypothetical protein
MSVDLLVVLVGEQSDFSDIHTPSLLGGVISYFSLQKNAIEVVVL